MVGGGRFIGALTRGATGGTGRLWGGGDELGDDPHSAYPADEIAWPYWSGDAGRRLSLIRPFGSRLRPPRYALPKGRRASRAAYGRGYMSHGAE
jgi:hypothetical protein